MVKDRGGGRKGMGSGRKGRTSREKVWFCGSVVNSRARGVWAVTGMSVGNWGGRRPVVGWAVGREDAMRCLVK
jgi:hypothetical protein